MISFPNGCIHIVTFEKLANSNIVKWSGNRPVDKVRIPDIVKAILKNKQVHGQIMLAKLNENEYECYDGLHRFEAIKRVVRKYPEYKNYKCMVYVMKDPTAGKVIDDFLEINKSISVPEIYRERLPNSERKEIIETVVKHFYNKYKKELFMPSNNPRIPKENRERFTDRVTSLYNELNPPDVSYLIKFLLKLSEAYKVNINLDEMTEKKCRICVDAGFWLFSKKDWHVYQKYGLTKEQLLN